MIIFIAAHDKNYGIGFKDHVPWPRMKADRERLHSLTNGKLIVMGERTYHEYKDVKHAFNTKQVIVVSRSLQSLNDAEVMHSLEDIVARSESQDVWVIGGGSIFTQLLPYAKKMYLTEINQAFEVDTYFPKYEATEWKVVEEHHYSADTDNPYPYTFRELERVR